METNIRTHRADTQRCIKQQSKGLDVTTCNPGYNFQQHPIKKQCSHKPQVVHSRSKSVTSHRQLLNDTSLYLIFYSHPLHMFHIQQWCVQCWVPIVNCKHCVTVKKTYSVANPTRSQQAGNKGHVVESRLAPTLCYSQWQEETIGKNVLGSWPELP